MNNKMISEDDAKKHRIKQSHIIAIRKFRRTMRTSVLSMSECAKSIDQFNAEIRRRGGLGSADNLTRLPK